MNLLAKFKQDLSLYLTKNSTSACDGLISFVIPEEFDLIFPLDINIWKHHLKSHLKIATGKDYKNILCYCNTDESVDETEALRRASENWIFKIDSIKYKGKKCLIYLERGSQTFINTFETIHNVNYGRQVKNESDTIFIQSSRTDGTELISDFRLSTFESILRNLLNGYSQFCCVNESSSAKHNILLTTNSNDTNLHANSNWTVIVCGNVCSNNSKKSNESAKEYLDKRTNDIHLTAIHKYGIRAKDDSNFIKLTEQLGKAVSKIDMLQVNYKSSLKLISNPSPAFIIYNSARLETLLSTFDFKVKDGYYEQLKPFDDMNLLSENLEWELLKHLIAFPETIEKSLGDLVNGKIAFHFLYKYLLSMTKTFSVYYSRKRVLMENRPHLQPIVHAKIHLLKAIKKIMNQTLNLLDIEPVSFM